MPRILVIDNYDSFTFNLVQYLGELGADTVVRRNDDITPDEVEAMGPEGILISPGPKRPEDAGVCNELIGRFGPRIPIFGVCLGHQCIGYVYGANIVRAPELVHGKTSPIFHRGEGVLAGLPIPFEATRYHSLVVERASVPPELKVTAETADELVMALRHRTHPVEGVQFHPESILTQHGHQILANWLARCE